MTNNQKRWAYVIAILILPLLVVHAFSSATSRLVCLIWISTVFPVSLIFMLLNSHSTIRLKNYSNPIVEKRLTYFTNVFVFLIGIGFFWFFTIPVLSGTYEVYVNHKSFLVVEDTVTNQTSPVLAIGFYSGLTLAKTPQENYEYIFPTTFRFGGSLYKFTILPGTDVILQASLVSE